MDPVLAVIVIAIMTWMMTPAGDQSCEVHPPFKTKQSSAEFLSKSHWISDSSLLSVEENVFGRRRHCAVRVRVEEGSKDTSLGNGSHSKEEEAEANLKKAGNSQRKLKGSKRKRKKEKRKRFRKRKKKRSSMKAKKKKG